MKINKILIVGLGSIGRRHLEILRSFYPDADIRAVTSKSIKNNKNILNGKFDNIDEAIKFEPQFAVISSPSSKHLKTSMKLALKKINLFIEKPISNSSKDVSELIKICKKNKIVSHVGYNLRFFFSLKKFKSLIDQGKIGKVLSVRCEVGQHLSSWRKNIKYQNTVSSQKKLGGGVLLELSHEIDYISWIFGDIKWIIPYVDKISELNIDVEDTAHLILGCLNRKMNNLSIVNLTMDFYRHDRKRECIAIGKKGSLQWDGIRGCVKFLKKGASHWEELYIDKNNIDKSYISQWKFFLKLLENKKRSFNSLNNALKIVEIVELIKKNSLNLKLKKFYRKS